MITSEEGSDNMPIVKEKETKIKHEIVKLADIVKQKYELLSKLTSKNIDKTIKESAKLNKKLEEIFVVTIEHCISSFTLSPLGKDLRRSIAYYTITNELRDIMHNANAIMEFVSMNKEVTSTFEWLPEFSHKILRRFDLLHKLVDTEKVEFVDEIILRDKSINEFYKNLVNTFLENIKVDPKTLKVKEKSITGFILAVKNFEIAGDNIKEIAEQIRFVLTGKIK